MAKAHSVLSAPHAKILMDRALESKLGIKAECESLGTAQSWRHTLNSVRVQARKKSCAIYPPDHPLYNQSPWETLTFSIDETTLYIRNSEAMLNSIKVTDLDTDSPITTQDLLNDY